MVAPVNWFVRSEPVRQYDPLSRPWNVIVAVWPESSSRSSRSKWYPIPDAWSGEPALAIDHSATRAATMSEPPGWKARFGNVRPPVAPAGKKVSFNGARKLHGTGPANPAPAT